MIRVTVNHYIKPGLINKNKDGHTFIHGYCTNNVNPTTCIPQRSCKQYTILNHECIANLKHEFIVNLKHEFIVNLKHEFIVSLKHELIVNLKPSLTDHRQLMFYLVICL